MKTLLYRFTLMIALSPGAVFATDQGCGKVLESQVIALPSELKIKPNMFEIARQESGDLELLESLGRFFAKMDEAGLTKLARQLHDHEFEEVIEAQEPEDREIVRRLLDSKKLPPRPATAKIEGLYERAIQTLKNFKRFENEFLSRPEYRDLFVATLERWKVFESVGEGASLAGLTGKQLAIYGAESFAATKERLRENRPLNETHRILIRTAAQLLSAMIIEHVELNEDLRAEILEAYDPKTLRSIIRRRPLLDNYETFIAEVFGLTSSITAATDLTDLLIFGTPLPMRPSALYGDLIESAKRLVLPLKNRASQIAVAEANKPVPARIATPVTLQFTTKDFFEPKNSVSVGRSKSEPVIENPERRSISIAESIVPDRAFRAFTDYAETPRPISEIRAGLVYEFWFLRDQRPTLQRVVFGEAAVEWLRDNPKLARSYLNALHLGRARFEGHQGLKDMVATSSRYDGKIYALKIITNAGYRGLTLNVNGVWQVIDFVPKDDVMRTVTYLTPLPLR